MPERVWTLVCEYAVLEQTRKVSIINEFTRFTCSVFPATIFTFFVVSRWKLFSGDIFRHKVAIFNKEGTVRRITRPNKVVFDPINVNVIGECDWTTAAAFENTPFSHEDTLTIEEIADGITVYTIDVPIVKR